MCGIVGYISQNDNLYIEPKLHFMRYALALDTLRGDDSTGVVTLSKRFTVRTLKTTMPGDQLVHHKEYRNKLVAGWAKIGHNRAATRGKVTTENAHPFTFDAVTMVHNGTLRDGGYSLDAYDHKIGAVDSMQIAHALSKAKPEDAGKVMSQINGSYALVWTDSRDESINMARNSERPLHFCFNTKKDIMWYMSDGNHLHSINKSFGNHECKGGSVFEMDKYKILKFRKGEVKPEVIKYDPFVSKVTVTHYQGGQKVTTTSTQAGGKASGASDEKQTKTGSTAMQRAHARWAKSLDTNTTRSIENGDTSYVKVEVQGKKRTIPKCMTSALRSEFCLTPSDLLRFQPLEAIPLDNGNYEVYGTVFHKPWNDIPFDMTIHNVSKVQYRAYRNEDWLVRPIGVCPAQEFDRRQSGVLGQLVHCDWLGYVRSSMSEQAASEDDDKEDAQVVVPGPDGRMIEWPKLRSMLEAGCINCCADILNDEVSNLMLVNNGQDLCCAPCVIEMDKALNKEEVN